MKRFANTSLFFFFLLCFFIKEEFPKFQIQTLQEPAWITEYNEKNQAQKWSEIEKLYEIPTNYETIIYSRIYTADVSSLFDTITILKGSEENIKPQSAVINEKGLIGIIESSTKNTSIVKLLTHPKTQISVKIRDNYGVLTGNENQELWILHIPKEAEINFGDEVFTSGLTKIPENIPVGKVVEIKEDEVGLTKKIKVAPYYQKEEIYYVAILGCENDE